MEPYLFVPDPRPVHALTLGLLGLALPFVPIAAPAQPLPSPPPPSATPSAAPLRIDRESVQIVPGSTVVVAVSGGAGAIAVDTTFGGVDARYDPSSQTLSLTGQTQGSGMVILSDATGQSASIAVLVAPSAGTLPAAVDVDLAGTVTQGFALARIRDAIAHAAQLQPGAAVALPDLALPPTLAPGAVLEAAANVHVDGKGLFVDTFGTTHVHLHVETLAPFDPALLLYSDDPEYVREDGVVFRQTSTIDAAHPARAYIYHAATVPGRRLSLVLQTTGTASRVQLVGGSVGPSTDYACVGHKATTRYLVERKLQESLVAPVTAAAPFVLPLNERDMAPQDLVNAIYDMRVVDGDPVRALVVATSGSEDPRTFVGAPALPGDGHGRKGEYALTSVRPIALSFTAANPVDPAFTIGLGATEGVPDFPNLLGGGRPLAGDYGVVRPLRITLSNPTPSPQSVFLQEVAESGPVTTTIWFDGDPAPTQIPAAKNPSTPYLVKQFALAPGETRTVTGVYMTDGASWFPMQLALTAVTPSVAPPNSCMQS